MDELVPITPDDMANKLLTTRSAAEMNAIIQEFNANIRKRDIIRANTFSELQDKVVDQIRQRLEQHADEFSNKDLLSYLTSMQQIIDRQTQPQVQDTPSVAIQNNITLNTSDNVQALSKESRDRIKSVVDNILSQQLADLNKNSDSTQGDDVIDGE